MQLTKKIILSTGLIALLTTGCNNSGSTQVENDTKQTVKVTVAKSVELEYYPRLNYSGTAEAGKEVNLGSAIPGRIEKINYSKGSFVPKGAVIAELSDEMLIQAQIELEAIRKDFERFSRLKEKGSMSIMDYDHIKAKYEASQSKVDMLKKNTSVIAPFGGVLVDIMVNEGENFSFIPSVSNDLKMKSGIATLMQLNPLKVTIEINEKELKSISKGQTVDIYFDAYPDETFQGKVTYISPVLSSISRTSTVEVSIPNNGTKLKPGMFCRTSIELEKTSGVFVPMNAILRQQGTGEDFIYVVNDNNTVSRVPITRGETKDTFVQIPEFGKDIRVVIDGKNKLEEGSQIEIVS